MQVLISVMGFHWSNNCPNTCRKFFKHVLNCIGGNAITYHQHHQASNSYNPKSEEGIVTYQYYRNELFTLVKNDTAAVTNAEKQRNFQARKKRERGKTMRNSVEAIHMLMTPFDNEISLNFLFGIHNNLLNSFQTKYCEFHQSKVACWLFICCKIVGGSQNIGLNCFNPVLDQIEFRLV